MSYDEVLQRQLNRLIAKMEANPDRGTPCVDCGATAKDCQITFVRHDHRCCPSCDARGGRVMHSEAHRILTAMINQENG